MSRILFLVVGLVSATNVIESFIGDLERVTIIGFEVNIWIYRIFWSIISIWIFYDYFKIRKIEKKG